MNKVRLSKDKMNTTQSRTKAVLLGFLLISLTTSAIPTNTYAQICPADFNGSLAATSYLPSEPEGEDNWTDIHNTSHGFSITVPETGGTVNFTINTGLEPGIFTKIYANMLAMIPAFATAPDPAAMAVLGNPSEQYTNWKRFYCIDGLDDKEQGKITLSISGSAYDEEEEDYTRTCEPFEIPPPGETLCPDTRTRGYTESKSEDVPDDMVVPYYAGPREILTKVANIVSDQYCASANNGADCINDNYFCDTTAFVPESGDVAAKDKDGICRIKPELWNSPKFQLPYAKMVDILCTDTIKKTSEFSANTTKLNSNICMYSPSVKLVGPVDPNALPRFVEAQIGTGTNEVPFDTDLYADRGESTNPDCPGNLANCNADGYLRRIFNNKILTYSKADLEALNNLSAKLGAGLSVAKGADGTGMSDPWSFDYIEKLGTINFLAEENRLFDPSLLPAGLAVMKDRENEAHIRIPNADNGALFVNGVPIGVRPFVGGGTNNSIQYKPFISTQLYGRGYTALVIGRNNSRFIPYLSINGSNLRELPIPGNAIYQYPYATFMNTRGDVIAIVNIRGNYQYMVYNKTNGGLSPWIPLGEEFGAAAKFTIDTQDQVHVLGQTKGGTNELRYAKFDFRTAEIAAPSVFGTPSTPLPRSATTVILYPRGLNGWGSLPMSMQVDNKGWAHIVASVSVPGSKYWFENDLYYTWLTPTGQQGPLEIAASSVEDYNSGYLARAGLFSENPGHYMSHQLSQIGSSVAIDPYDGTVYIVYINYMLHSNEYGQSYQAAYTKRIAPNQWKQNVKLSDRSVFQYSMVNNIFVDRYGNFGFTVWDRGTKFNLTTRKFDGAGEKMCLFDHSTNLFVMGKFLQESFRCNYSGEDIAYVVAPSNRNSNGVMQFKQGSQILQLPPR